jgi:hypothetical protein
MRGRREVGRVRRAGGWESSRHPGAEGGGARWRRDGADMRLPLHLYTQRSDSSWGVSVSAPTPLMSVSIPLIPGSVCVSVSIASISSLLVALPVPERARGASYKYLFVPSSAPWAAATKGPELF